MPTSVFILWLLFMKNVDVEYKVKIFFKLEIIVFTNV